MKFGEVYRRDWDGLVVMFIGTTKHYFETDEMAASPGTIIVLTLDRGEIHDKPGQPVYWPLYGTAVASDLTDFSLVNDD